MDEHDQVRYRHHQDMVSRLIAGELILVPIRNRIADMDYIYTLNETAACIWQLLDGQHSLEQVREQICAEFDVDTLEAQQDLQEILGSLLEIGALETV